MPFYRGEGGSGLAISSSEGTAYVAEAKQHALTAETHATNASASATTASNAVTHVGTTPPANPAVTKRWMDSATGREYIYFDDGDTAQWVEIGADVAGSASTKYTQFQAAGTGSVLRTAEDKLRESVSVKDFGALLNGTTDDLAAFTNAAATGKPVVIEGASTFLSADVSGRFYSFGTVRIFGNGYADIKDLSKDVTKPSKNIKNKAEIIAHRGFVKQAPQNTMLAFSTALARGADSLEFDLQVSSDGVIYVFHDTTVDALTSGTGTFTTLTSATIDGLTFDATAGTPFASESIPRLTDVLKLARDAGVKIYPEIKGTWTNAQMQTLLQQLSDYGYNNENCILQAGYIVYCEDFRNLSTTIGISYVGAGDFTNSKTFIDRLKKLGGYTALSWNLADLIAYPDLINHSYSRGVDVVAWTIITDDQIRQLRALGVNKFMCDVSAGVQI